MKMAKLDKDVCVDVFVCVLAKDLANHFTDMVLLYSLNLLIGKVKVYYYLGEGYHQPIKNIALISRLKK